MRVSRAALLVGTGLGCAFHSAQGEEQAPSGPETQSRFNNLKPIEHQPASAMLKWLLHRNPGPWRSNLPPDETRPGSPPPRRVEGGAMRVTFVGHSTVLIQQDNLNVLTDPIWSDRASPVPFLGPKRVRPPGIRFEDLPPIDVVLVSHNHYDHMDLPTLKRLASTFPPLRFFVGRGNAEVLASAGVKNVTEVEWWQSIPLTGEVTLASVPAQHFSNRGIFDRDKALWTGFALKGPSGTTYFAGDTGLGPHFALIRERLGPVRLALLPIGAFRPEWFMGPVHLSPRDAVAAHQALGAQTSIPIHYGTFRLADDGELEPVVELARAAEEALGTDEPFRPLGFGQAREIP